MKRKAVNEARPLHKSSSIGVQCEKLCVVLIIDSLLHIILHLS